MKTQQAIGKLTVTNTDKITESTHHNIWLALKKHDFYSVGEPALWETGLLKVSDERYIMNGKEAATEYINKLAAVLTEKGIPELELTGEITLVTTGDENSDDIVVHRILVRDNQALYAQATLNWDAYKVA
jgi:hypothetical protein